MAGKNLTDFLVKPLQFVIYCYFLLLYEAAGESQGAVLATSNVVFVSPSGQSVDISVWPLTEGCLCPNQSYYCTAKNVTGVRLILNNYTDEVNYNSHLMHNQENGSIHGLEYIFSEGEMDITAQICIVDNKSNETRVICEAYFNENDNMIDFTACVVGKEDNNKFF